MNKDLIRQRFRKSLESYNKNAVIQKQMAEKLITFLSKKTYSNILEIGCGTGFLTEQIEKNISFQSYKAIDIVDECETYISKISKKVAFIPGNIENYITNSNEKFDLIISNAALQWVDNFEGIINRLKQRLKPNGELIISTFGIENFREISLITGTSLKYYSPEELKELFPESKICSDIETIVFNTAKEVLNHLKLTGVNAIEHKIWTKKDLQQFTKDYLQVCPNKITLTYNPIYIIIKNSPTG